MAWRGVAVVVRQGAVRPAVAGLDPVRLGMVRQLRHVMAGCGRARLGVFRYGAVWQSRLGLTRLGVAGQGMAG